MKISLIVLILFAYLPMPAQDVPGKNKRTCRVIFLNKTADAPDKAYIFDGKNSQKVNLSGVNFSKLIELESGPLTIGMTPNEVALPEEFPLGAPTVRIGEEMTDFYLLVVSDLGNRILPIKMQPLNIDDGKLKPGETLWINLTPHNVAAKLGEEQVLIPSMKQTVSPPPLEESGYYGAHFIYQPEGGSSYLPIMKKSWWFDATSKNLGFIVSSGSRLPRIFTVRDRREQMAVTTENESVDSKVN